VTSGTFFGTAFFPLCGKLVNSRQPFRHGDCGYRRSVGQREGGEGEDQMCGDASLKLFCDDILPVARIALCMLSLGFVA
jgi:hypothetical protein